MNGIFIIENLLDDTECDKFIKIINEHLNMHTYSGFFNKYIYDYQLAGFVWDKIKDKLDGLNIIIKNNQKYEIKGLAEKINIVYYNNDKIKQHKDKIFIENNFMTMFSLLIYLNDDFIDGSTCFYQDNNCTKIKPKKGLGVIFDIDILHDCDIVIGEKYGINFKLVYSILSEVIV